MLCILLKAGADNTCIATTALSLRAVIDAFGVRNHPQTVLDMLVNMCVKHYIRMFIAKGGC